MDFNVTKNGTDFTVNVIETPKMEKCVLCGEQTNVPVSMDINLRKFYIEGAGQLCKECYDKIN